MIIGFTGTQTGMTAVQKHTFKTLISELKPTEFHHGDCVGADEDAHIIVREVLPNCKIVIHPPESIFKQAMCVGDETKEPLPYLVRNHNIVDAVDFMVATPREHVEQLRSGTWATVRYSIKTKKPIRLIYLDGTTRIIL